MELIFIIALTALTAQRIGHYRKLRTILKEHVAVVR